MTLDTKIYIQGEIGALDVFEYVLHQLLEFDEHPGSGGGPRPRDLVNTTAGADTDWITKATLDTWTMETIVGQGLPAWLMVHYKPAGDYRTSAEAAEHDEDICNIPASEYFDGERPVCDSAGHTPACRLEVSMDTAYGFAGQGGMRCDHLHGVILARLTEFLGNLGVAWSWMNEYTGEIHPGGEGLGEFLKAGDGANAWFDQVAWPAITAHIAAETDGR